LDGDIEYKIHQRTVDGVQNFKIRPGTLMKTTWRNLQGVSVAFDFGDGSQIEYNSEVRSEKTQLGIRAVCLAASIASVQDKLQILKAGMTIP
jgi:hypothetical protein